MEIHSICPLLVVLVSAAAAILILFSGKSPRLRETWTFAAAILKFGLVASLFPAVREGQIVVFTFGHLFSGIPLSFRVDALGLYFALLSSGLWIVTSVYSVGYMRKLKEPEQTRYFASFALSLSAAARIAFAGDLITFFIFFELLTLATYPLVAHKETREAIQGGRKYLVYSLTAAALLLFAIAWTWQRTGSLAFQPGGFLGGHFSSTEFLILFVFFIYGCGVKAALFPVHAWLPTAMVAPTPVSALLHAVAVVKAGVFGILRMTGFVFGPELLSETGMGALLAAVAAFTILGASIMALAQNNLKRRLAYSTISQLSYIILGSALLAPSGYLGAILHLSNHAFLKITLFFCAGAIYATTHKENISDLRGVGYRMPWTLAAFTVGALGLSGFPPLCGFISKWYLGKGALEAQNWTALIVYLSSGLLNAAYLLPVVFTAFSRSGEAVPARDEGPWTITLPLVGTALLAIAFGLIPPLVFGQIEFAWISVSRIFGGAG